jgi:hypothetical protein
MAEDSSSESPETPRQSRSLGSRKLQVWLASAAAIVGIATGVFTLRDQLFGSDSDSGGTEETIPYFDAAVGHLQQSQDFVGFLQTHDGDAVRLNAGFQVALDDFSVDGFGEARQASEEPGAAPWVRLYTECTPPLSGADQEQFDLGFRDELVIGRCMGDDLFVDGPDTDESGIYVIHGAPRIEGYFVVDIGDLHMGFTPITLTPISFEEASERA